jgi:hypothetical protein
MIAQSLYQALYHPPSFSLEKNYDITSRLPYWYGGVSIGNAPTTSAWQELSGGDICRRPENLGYALLVSDGPANAINAIRLSDAAPMGTITVTGAPTTYLPSDWEELSSAKIDGVSIFCIGDYGDNPNTRSSFNLIFFPEPVITGSNITVSSGVQVVNCVFPAANMPTHKDCEATIFDPVSKKVFILTKRDAVQKIYSLAYQASYTGQQTLTYEGTMWSLPSSTTVPLAATACYAVGACISSDGTEILVKNYSNVYRFARDRATQTVPQALASAGVLVPSYVGGGSNTPKKSHPNAEPQGETIFFSANSKDYYTASEYLTSEGSSPTQFPIFKYVRATKTPTVTSFQKGVSPSAGYTGVTDTYIWQTNPTTVRGTETTFVVDITPGTPTDDRRALLKFDLSSIPTNATVLYAKLRLYINVEGQGWSWHRVLIPWDENSTHTSLGGISADGIKAVIAPSSKNGVNLDGVAGQFVIDNIKTSDVQYMVANPAQNFGWLGINLDTATGDGIQFDSSQSVTAARRPELTVSYYV